MPSCYDLEMAGRLYGLRCWLVVAVTQTLIACSPQLTIDESTFVSCDEAQPECPTNMKCNVTLGRCLSVTQTDDQVPYIVPGSQTFSREIAAAGQTVNVAFDVSEPLAFPPAVHFGSPSGALLELVSVTDTRYVYAYNVTPADGESTHSILADLVDAAGNQSAAQLVGSFRTDLSPPTPAVRLLSPRLTRLGQTLTVVVELNEELLESPKVEAGAMVFSEVARVGRAYTFEHMATVEDAEGPHDLTVATTDLAGNTAAATSAQLFELDFTKPTVPSLASVSTPFVRAAQNTTFSFVVSEALADDPLVELRLGAAVISAARVSRVGLEYTYTQKLDGEPEGVWSIWIASASDVAGNAMDETQLGAFTFDRTAPAVAGLVASPALLSLVPCRDLTSIQFSLSEAPTLGLSVSVAGRPAACTNTGAVFACAYQATAADAEGVANIAVTALDASGNIGFASSLVQFDFTKPQLVAGSVNPARAKLNDAVLLNIATSEILSQPPSLSVSGADAPTFQFSSGTSYVFTHTAVQGAGSGSYAVQATLQDLAGNQSDPINVASGELDVTVPVIQNVTTDSAIYSRVSGHNTVTVDFDLSESLDAAPADLAVVIEGRRAVCDPYDAGHYTCTYVVDAANTEGTRNISITARDAAGNVATDSAIVSFDFTAPSVVQSSASPPLAKLSDTIILSLLASESLASAPSMTVTGPAPLALSPIAQTLYSYSHTVTSLDTNGTYAIEVVLTDLAGNTSDAQTLTSVALDATVPALSLLTPAAGSVYSRQTGHNTISFTFNSSESFVGSGALLSVSVGDGLASCQPYSVTPPNYTCTYSVTLADTEGTQTVFISARDAAGNTASVSRTIEFDFTAPSFVVPPRLQRDDNYAPARVSDTEWYLNRAGVGAVPASPTVLISFSVSEQLVGDPPLTPAAFSTSHAGLGYTLTYVQPSSGPDGTTTLTTELEDPVGNRSGVLQVGLLRIDNTAPTLTIANTLHQRFPWGDPTSQTPRQVLSLSGTTEAFATLYAYSGPSLLTSIEIARGTADAAGALSPLSWTTGDRAQVYALLRDRAGNANASTAALVARGRWTATYGNSSSGNPHTMTRVAASEDVRYGSLVAEPPFPSINYSLVAVNDSSSESQSDVGNDSWALTPTSYSTSAPAGRDGAAIAYDSVSKSIMMFGGMDYFPGSPSTLNTYSDTWFFDGRQWAAKPIAGPGARAFASMAYFETGSSTTSAMVIFGGAQFTGTSINYTTANYADDLWFYSNGVYTQHATLSTRPSRRIKALLIADPARNRMLLIGGFVPGSTSVTPASDVWELKVAASPTTTNRFVWNQLIASSGPPAPAPFNGYGLAAAIDTDRDVLVIQSPGSTFSAPPNYTYETSLSTPLSASSVFTLVCGASCVNNIYSPRRDGKLIYDPARKKTLLVASMSDNSSPPREEYSDLWAWDGTRWTNQTCTSGPFVPGCMSQRTFMGVQPPDSSSGDVASRSAATYDVARQQIVHVVRNVNGAPFTGAPIGSASVYSLKYFRSSRPALQSSFDLSASGIGANKLTQIDISANASGSGYLPISAGGTLVTGSVLSLWKDALTSTPWRTGGWFDQVQHTIPGLSPLTISLSSTLQDWVTSDGRIVVRVTPLQSANGDVSGATSSQRASTQVDYVSITTHYTQ